MYNDSLCCKDLHRQDILYKYEDYFTIVQNFDNNYIHFNEPFIQRNDMHVQISRQLLSNNSSNINLYGVDIYYDQTPTHLEYEKHKDDKSYELGNLIGFAKMI